MCDGAPDCDNAADEEFTLCNPEGRLLLHVILELKITIINFIGTRLEGYG